MKRVFIFAVRAYQMAVGPFLPPSCRFFPSCSHYSAQAYEKYGALKGTWLSVKRLSKCHPFHPGGLDPLT